MTEPGRGPSLADELRALSFESSAYGRVLNLDDALSAVEGRTPYREGMDGSLMPTSEGRVPPCPCVRKNHGDVTWRCPNPAMNGGSCDPCRHDRCPTSPTPTPEVQP